MTVTVAQVEQHRTAVTGVVTLMERDLRDAWRTLDWGNAAAVQALMQALLPELGAAYVDQAAVLAGDFYAETRDGSSAPGLARPVLAVPPPQARFDALAGWGAAPLYSSAPLQALALQRLVGGMTRVVRDGDRGTVVASAEADRSPTRWARRTTASGCAFCAMLSTRGGAYRSDHSAAESHDDCRCVVVPIHRGDEVEPTSWDAKYEAAYAAAARETDGTTPAVLAHMRAALGTH